MAPHSFILVINIFVTLTLLSFNGISAVNYEVVVDNPQDPGTKRWETEVGGIPFTKQLMAEVNEYLWSTILKQTGDERKPVQTVTVNITANCPGMAVAVGENISISAIFLRDYKGPMTLTKEFSSLMYHEMTHSFQWNGEGTTPRELVEGIADYTILKKNIFAPGFVPPGAGDKWDVGYDTTARFLEYCDSLVPDFVAKLNKMMRKSYNPSYWSELTGKTVDQLWTDYKAKYPNPALKTLASSRALLMI
ncbi:uncharacterized protein LOC143624638 [Bidens hawaiensis]|uniref:uncharacterized protein LOC143624637 n=1 Tax=Bidens hawaiensis TaxID=980011 RepID=UPI004049D652